MNSMYFVDVVILIAAVYLLYMAISMKRTGKIHKSMMAPEMAAKCEDVGGFINYIFPWVLAFAIVAIVAGVAGFAMDYFRVSSVSTYVTSGAFIIMFFFFVYIYRKGLNKYFKL